MTLTELKYLITLHKVKNFSKAAELCYVSQPTLSNGIKKLEETLGVVLFERAYHEIKTTFAGEQIVHRAKKILTEVQDIQQMARGLQNPFAEPLKLGVIYTLSPFLLANAITALQQKEPELQLIIQENYTHKLAQALEEGAIDAAIIALPISLPNANIIPLYEEPFVALLPAKDPLANQHALSTDDLIDKKLLVLAKGHCLRDHVISFCPECNWDKADPDSLWIEAGSLETIRHMVAMGIGISIFPSMSASMPYYNDHYLVTRPFKKPAPTRTLALAWRTTDPRTQVFDVLARNLSISFNNHFSTAYP